LALFENTAATSIAAWVEKYRAIFSTLVPEPEAKSAILIMSKYSDKLVF
jgi:hypothetical protein